MKAANEFSPVSRRWAARWTSAVTAWWTCAGVRVPSRYFDSPWNWMRHRPSRAVAAICGSGSSAGYHGPLGQDRGGHGDELVHHVVLVGPPWQHDEPTAEHQVRPQAESNRRAQFCRLLPHHSVMRSMRGLRTIRTSACFLGGSHAVPCTMSPKRSQQDSNLRCRLRRTASFPLDHGSTVREEGIEPSMPRRRGLRPAEHTACSTRAWGE
jgi:hypothetical protein